MAARQNSQNMGDIRLDEAALKKDPTAVFDILEKLGEGCVARRAGAAWGGATDATRFERTRPPCRPPHARWNCE